MSKQARPCNRVKLRLGNVCSKIGSGSTPRGGNSVYLDEGVALIRSQNVLNDRFNPEGLAFIDEEHAKQLKGVTINAEDVLLNITGDSVARVCQVSSSVLPARVNQHVAIIRPDSNKLDPKYLRYYLVNPQIQQELLAMAGAGATRNALTKGMIEQLEIDAPESIDDQHAIAYILGTLDDKIDLNRRMNETLEAMARAIFKSWFVDFDPVHAKASGEPPESICRRLGLTPDVLALFPDSFQDSELGGIPAGWAVRSLDSVADFLNGLALQKYPTTDDCWLPVIKIAQLRAGHTVGADHASTEIPPAYVVQDGDVLFSWSGSLEVEIWCGGPGALNQHLFKVTSSDYPKWFYFLWTRHHLQEFRDIAANKATTMGHIQRKHLTDAKLFCPDENLLSSMEAIVGPLISKLVSCRLEANEMTSMRDTLLPRLLSGELSVPELEAAA